jgi:hypothetical protein
MHPTANSVMDTNATAPSASGKHRPDHGHGPRRHHRSHEFRKSLWLLNGPLITAIEVILDKDAAGIPIDARGWLSVQSAGASVFVTTRKATY